jgi:hypothetical protein
MCVKVKVKVKNCHELELELDLCVPSTAGNSFCHCAVTFWGYTVVWGSWIATSVGTGELRCVLVLNDANRRILSADL